MLGQPQGQRAVGRAMTRQHFLCPCCPHGHPVRQGLTDLFTGWDVEAWRGHLACSMTASPELGLGDSSTGHSPPGPVFLRGEEGMGLHDP